MNQTWFHFYGRQMGMTESEVDRMRYGKFLDYLACMNIQNGAKPKKKKKKLNFEDIFNMR